MSSFLPSVNDVAAVGLPGETRMTGAAAKADTAARGRGRSFDTIFDQSGRSGESASGGKEMAASGEPEQAEPAQVEQSSPSGAAGQSADTPSAAALLPPENVPSRRATEEDQSDQDGWPDAVLHRRFEGEGARQSAGQTTLLGGAIVAGADQMRPIRGENAAESSAIISKKGTVDIPLRDAARGQGAGAPRLAIPDREGGGGMPAESGATASRNTAAVAQAGTAGQGAAVVPGSVGGQLASAASGHGAGLTSAAGAGPETVAALPGAAAEPGLRNAPGAGQAALWLLQSGAREHSLAPSQYRSEGAQMLPSPGAAPADVSPQIRATVHDRFTPNPNGAPVATVASDTPQASAALQRAAADRPGGDALVDRLANTVSDLAASEPRATRDLSTETRAVSQTPQHRPGTAQQIAVQIADAMRGGGGRPVDLTLNPAELGRVRLTLSAADGTMAVQITAERGETLDLMRRHADLLAQEFRNIGYGGTAFEFARQSGGQSRPDADSPKLAEAFSDTGAPRPDGGPARTPLPVATDRLDLRL